MPFVKMQCNFCNKEYIGGQFACRISKYCNRVCMAKAYSNPIVEINCYSCKKPFNIKQSNQKRKRKFCSPLCITYTGPKESLGHLKGKGFWDTATVSEKFLKLKKLFEQRVIRNDGCWDWKGVVLSTGYGNVMYGRKALGAHRASWMIHKGEIPNKMFVLHKCDNPKCTNPDHLFLGTAKDNSKDMIEKNRGRWSK